MNTCSYRICGLILILLLSAAFAMGDDSSRKGLSWDDDYKIISARNIFSRNRLPETRPVITGARQVQVKAAEEESYLILRGITRQADGFIAFIEDSRTNGMKKIRKGEKIAGGEVKDITIDFVTYELKGKDIKVKTGMAMGGEIAQSVTGISSGFSPLQQQGVFNFSSGVQSDVQETPKGEDSNAILQRLKERRKKELGE